MKKIITLILLLVGMVCTVSATTLHIGMEPNYTGDVYVYRYGGSSPDNWDNMGDSQKATVEGNLYGRRWYSIDMNGNNSAIVRYDNWLKRGAAVTGISGDDCYIYLSTNTVTAVDNTETHETGILASQGWQNMKFSNSIDNKWDNDANECVKVDDNTFAYTLTKEAIGANTSVYFRFKLDNGVFFVGNYYWVDHYFRIVAPSDNTAILIDANTSSVLHKTDWTNNWLLTVPTYNYDKLVFTIKDLSSGRTFDDSNTWQIRVDAYISKTITAAGYATFGSNANVDFSKAIPTTENNSFVAKKGKVQSNGTISWTNATTLYGGEGALLQGNADTYLIPVAASATADTENNDFKAIDSKTKISGANRYILTNQKATGGDGTLGFYKVNSEGSWCAANTAYLETSVTPWAHDYFPLDDESASVERIVNELQDANPVYDLQGRCVTNPQKGLYILNGKKVVIK